MEKYFIIFGDYYLSITQKNYLGFATEIFGNIVLKKGNVDSILEPIRGSGLNLALEANSALTLDEFALADEQTYYVALTKSSQIVLKGFIKPDGMQQSWVNEEWLVNIEVIDGLGAMKDLSFVQSNGTHFTGKISLFDVIKGCLDRTGLSFTINSSIKLSYDGYTGTNILKDTYVNASRYYKEDGSTIMDCNEVLTSILNIFSAIITQQDGQWWILRPNDLNQSKVTPFINNTTDEVFNKNLNYILGSQIDNYYPHHCDANQQIEMKGAISAYRLRYEYGYVTGIFNNGNLYHDSNLNYDGWTINPDYFGQLINDPLSSNGFKITPLINPSSSHILVTSDTVPILNNTTFSLKASLTTNGVALFAFNVRIGSYYLKPDGEWTTTATKIIYSFISYNNEITTQNIEVKSNLVPISGNVYIEIYVPEVGTNSEWASICEIDDINLIPVNSDGIVGQFYTVSRTNPPSSITKENQTVFNGDSTSLLIGSLYKSDKVTLTEYWNRTGFIENKPILLISAEDDLRVQRNPIKIFSGGIFGYLPYLSVISINNVLGLFMFTEYSYDLGTNKISAKLTQFYNDEVGDIEFLISPDYGSTVKPTIKG